MSENIIPIVELNGGLRAAFINLPHFRNTAIQIVVNAGSMHEQPNEYGSAHLLEHLAFQGTEKFETNAILERHRRHVDVQLDAYTSSTRTVYEASGSRLESALQLVGQLALYPLHNYNHLEKEREPILEEIKQERYNSFRYANERHNAIIGGLRYARGIAGTEQNVLSLTSDQLTRFYDRHYNLKNISLVVCSPEPITLQRKLTEILLLNRNDQEGATPTLLKLPWFTSVKSNTASLEYVQIDQEAPTDLTLHIESNKSSSEKDIIIDSLTALALSIAVHKSLRKDRSLVYSAHAGLQLLTNNSFDTRENYPEIYIKTNLSSNKSVIALDAIKTDVLQKKIDPEIISYVLRDASRRNSYYYESSPVSLVSSIMSLLRNANTDTINLEEYSNIVLDTSIENIQSNVRNLTERKTLVAASSPSHEALDRIGEWTTSRYSKSASQVDFILPIL